MEKKDINTKNKYKIYVHSKNIKKERKFKGAIQRLIKI